MLKETILFKTALMPDYFEFTAEELFKATSNTEPSRVKRYAGICKGKGIDYCFDVEYRGVHYEIKNLREMKAFLRNDSLDG